MYSRMIYINGDKVTDPPGELYQLGSDIWHGLGIDRSRYIRYANDQLITRENELTLEIASTDSAVITACGLARAALIDTVLKIRSEETAAFTEQYVNKFVSDGDSDGVFDLIDDCPADITKICFVDIPENRDNCRDTPIDEVADTSGVFRGCSPSQKDTDGDKVNDAIDVCPLTPFDEIADIDGVGCSPTQKDTDQDGLNDAIDLCPKSDGEFAVNADGCSINEIDSDDDGINDYEDPYPLQHATECRD